MFDIRKKLRIFSYIELLWFYLFWVGLFRWILNYGRVFWGIKLNFLWIMIVKFVVFNWIIFEIWGIFFRKYLLVNFLIGLFKKKLNWMELNIKCFIKICWVKSKLIGIFYNFFEGYEMGRKSLKYFLRVLRLKIVDFKGMWNCNECFS